MKRFADFIRKVCRLGIDPALPESETRYIYLTNVTAVAAVITLITYIPHFARFGGATHVAITVGQLAVWAPPLLLNHYQKHWAATTLLAVGALTLMPAQAYLYGPEFGHHFFLLAVVVASFLLYHPRHGFTMWLVSVAAGLAFGGVVLAGDAFTDAPLALPAAAVPFVRTPTILGVAVVLGVLAYYSRTRTLSAEAQAQREYEKSERLLRNILPDAIAERLKEKEATIADQFSEVTVLFADIAGFTPLSTELSPKEIVDLLNEVFSEFDHIAEKYGLEKIKTIGDAYMAAGGLPEPRDDHAGAIAGAALEMIEVPERLGSAIDIRIGIHTGPVVAGVIGLKKFAYDLWGDTVNIAARMESHGLPGQIQLTRNTFEHLEGHFELEARGTIEVKGKGEMQTWFLKGPIPQ